MAKQIIIYTTPVCMYCRQAKSFFAVRGISYTEKDVLHDLAAREEMFKKSGSKHVPVIDLGKELMVGFDRNRLVRIFG